MYQVNEVSWSISDSVVSFIDTPGAYPGLGAEQRGQASAIANSIECCMSF